MKYLLILLLVPSISFCQRSIIPKKLDDNAYMFTDIPVKIENGHGEKIAVLFSGKVDKYIWTDLVKKNNNSEKEAFDYIAWILSLRAQSSLKNELSFEPLKKQFFFNDRENFICDYKMMGRNGYGNLIEMSYLVTSASEYSTKSAGDTNYVPSKITVPDLKSIFNKTIL